MIIYIVAFQSNHFLDNTGWWTIYIALYTGQLTHSIIYRATDTTIIMAIDTTIYMASNRHDNRHNINGHMIDYRQ